MTRRMLCAGLLAVLLLVGGAGWYLYRPEKKFIDDVVDEPFPGEVADDFPVGSMRSVNGR